MGPTRSSQLGIAAGNAAAHNRNDHNFHTAPL
jgi:hypothetical protein